jgi:hypothetical protein
MSQEGWPFENAIRGIAVREEFAGEECECYDRRRVDPHEDGCPAAEEPDYDGTLRPNALHRRWRAGALRQQRRVGDRPPLVKTRTVS